MTLLEQLQKLASSSAALRVAHTKEAGAVESIGKALINNPVGTGLGVLTASQIPSAGKSTYKKNKAGFNPKVHKQTLGMES